MTTDTSIADKVDRALWNNSTLRSTDYWQIGVAVKDGIVSLSGHVISTTNQRQAESAARAVPGVQVLISHLVPDDKIVREVAMSLGKIEYVYGDKFLTGAQNGVVVLTGEVGSAAKRSLAEKYASDIPEVRGVINSVRAPGVNLEAEDQRFLQPAVGDQLYFRDTLSGKVQRVIINPNNRRVVAMVLRGRIQGAQPNLAPTEYGESQVAERLVVIPMRAVRFLTRGAGFLNIDFAEAVTSKDFDLSGFTAPPVDWTPPYPYHREDILFPVEPVADVKETQPEVAGIPVVLPLSQPAIPVVVPV